MSQAEALLGAGLSVLGLDRNRLKASAKGVGEKPVLAWWLRASNDSLAVVDQRSVGNGQRAAGDARVKW